MFEFTRNFYSPVGPIADEGGSEEKSTPKTLFFPKGRTIASELSRLNKAFGNVSEKKTIIGQLSDLADAAEAGKIGGGSGALIVHEIIGDGGDHLDKTWQEIYDAMANDTPVLVQNSHIGSDHTVNVSMYQVSGVWSWYKIDGDSERLAYSVMYIATDAAEIKYICYSPDNYPVVYEED